MFMARLFFNKASIQRCSTPLLFVDTRKAYYRVILELVLGPLLTKAEHEALIESANMDVLRKQKVLVDLEMNIVC